MDEKLLDKLNCFVDLHLHLDGSLSINCAKHLLKMNGFDSIDDAALKTMLRSNKNDKDLNDFLKKFDLPIKLLQTKEALTYATKTLLDELYNDGVMYAEIRFAPQNHLKKGLSQEDVVKACLCGIKNSKIDCNLILCMMRGAKYNTNKETIDIAKKYLGKGVCLIDLAGAEGLYPTSDYKDLFLYAKSLNVPFTIHAGEADSYKSVSDAISFGAIRIGHGIRALEDKETIKNITSKNITLEICPTSNICTKIFNNISRYPFDDLINNGIKFCINTDDMAVCDTNIKNEFKIFNKVYPLDIKLFKQIITTSIESAMASANVKQKLKDKLNANIEE